MVHMTVYIALAILLFLVLWKPWRSGYGLITTNQGQGIKTLFDSPENSQCVPGPGAMAGYYTGEGSGGFCGAQQTVHKMGHEYMITSGVGGPLLS